MKYLLVTAVVLVAFWIWRNNRRADQAAPPPPPGHAPWASLPPWWLAATAACTCRPMKRCKGGTAAIAARNTAARPKGPQADAGMCQMRA
jgi:hypothetical protein